MLTVVLVMTCAVPASSMSLENDSGSKAADATHFSPNLSCTRAQIVTFLYRDMK